MPWQDRYERASFRGIGFRVQGDETEVGRRTKFYDLPFDESGGSASRDLGKAARTHQITAVIRGNNYDLDLAELMDALEEPGPGVLVHPYFGRHTVVIDGLAQISQSTENGGMATISFKFRKHRDQKNPLQILDSSNAALVAADEALLSLDEDFVDSFTVSRAQEFVRESAESTFGTMLDELRALNSDIGTILAIPSKVAEEIDALSQQIASLINAPQDLINAIQGVIFSVMDSIDRVVDAVADTPSFATGTTTVTTSGTAAPVETTLSALSRRGTGAVGSLVPSTTVAGDIGSTVPDVPMVDTPDRDTERSNQAAAIRAFRGSSIVSIAKRSIGMVFVSKAQTDNFRTKLFDEIDAVLEDDTLGDDAYVHLRKLRAAMHRYLLQASANAPQLVTYTPADTLSTLVIAYNLYEDANRDLDIDARNIEQVENPLFAPVLAPLEVVSND